MAAVTDPDGVEWRVRRRWWPFWDVFDIVDIAFLDWVGVVLALPLLILWPFWLLAKLFGVRWKIIVERGGAEAHHELVRWWGASEARIAELTQEIRQGARSGYFQI